MQIDSTPPTLKMVSVNVLKPYEKNARTHSPEQIQQIAKSIQEFGFLNPVLVRDDYSLLAGHGRVEAAKTLGLSEIPVVFVGHLTPEQAKAYVLADNKIALNAGWDYDLLSQELASLQGLDFDISLTGFSDGEIEKLFAPEDSLDDDDNSEKEEEASDDKDRKFILGAYQFSISGEDYHEWVRQMAGIAGSFGKEEIISEIKTRLEL
jgi:ParB-like chromosome segregation protein Spo0J